MAVPRQDKNAVYIDNSKKVRGVNGVVNMRKRTYPREQMDFPLLFEGILTHSPQCQTYLLNQKRK